MFSTIESSKNQGVPVELFLFTFGTGVNDFYAYNSSDSPITYNGKTYTPFPIARDKIVISGNGDKSNLSLSMSSYSALYDKFKYYPPQTAISLIIYNGHIGDNEFLVLWTGKVLSYKQEGEGDTISFSCEPSTIAMSRVGLKRRYQYGCPHDLYGSQCKATKVPITSTVSTLYDNAIDLPTNWTADTGKLKFLSGIAEWTTSGVTYRRSIIDILGASTNQLILSGNTPELTVGQTVTLLRGCNHKTDDCKNVHNNILNFGGQKDIPLKNPIGLKNGFY